MLTINACEQARSAPTSGPVAVPAATAYFIKFKVKSGKNAAFELSDTLAQIEVALCMPFSALGSNKEATQSS